MIHKLHRNGFSPVWVILWADNWGFWENVLSQKLHLNDSGVKWEKVQTGDHFCKLLSKYISWSIEMWGFHLDDTSWSIEMWGFHLDDTYKVPDSPISPHHKFTKPKITQPLKNGDLWQFLGYNSILGLNRDQVFSRGWHILLSW